MSRSQISENMGMVCAVSYTVNTLKSEENGPHYIHDNIRWIFLNKKKNFVFCLNFTEVSSYGLSNGSDNGLAPNRWQAFIWTNTDQGLQGHTKPSIGPKEFIPQSVERLHSCELDLFAAVLTVLNVWTCSKGQMSRSNTVQQTLDVSCCISNDKVLHVCTSSFIKVWNKP